MKSEARLNKEYHKCQRVFHICERPRPSPDAVGSRLNIGAVYASQGNYDEALVQYHQALEVFLAVARPRPMFLAVTAGPGTPDVATSYQNANRSTVLCMDLTNVWT